MENGETPTRGMSDTIKVALIGASATILVAIISSFVALMNRTPVVPAPTDIPTIVVTESATNTENASFTVTSAPVATGTPDEQTASQVVTETGFAFASKISADGAALDPGLTFPPTVKEIYAVFQPDRTPPGLRISHPNPTASTYYAYLAPDGAGRPATVGWQWLLNGEVVNDYETTTDVGYFWLSVYARGEQGLFEGTLGPTGVYDVMITLAGNPVLHAQLVAEPKD